jgi:hypothetical protein
MKRKEMIHLLNSAIDGNELMIILQAIYKIK